MKELFQFFWRGMAMGLAEVIPGVSGGTIAFITGIYERLLGVIAKIRITLIKEFRANGWRGIWKTLDGNFVVSLMVGMVTGIVIGVFALTWILDNYPQLLWAFFSGLIIASSFYIGSKIKRWNWVRVALLIVGIQVAYQLSVAVPVQADPSFFYLLFCGAVAISALILPGISGSFILLILGMYTVVIPSLKELLKDPVGGPYMIIVPFAIGCVIGLFSIARLLTWTFKRYHDQTLALLTGFIAGSLHKIWPWRNVVEWVNKETNVRVAEMPTGDGKWVPLIEENVFPGNYNGEPMIPLVIICFISGVIILFFMERGSSWENPGKQ